MVSATNISVLFNGLPLFEKISFLINERDRIGLTGKNGAGKSTLLKILSGIQQPDEGYLARPNGFKVGYLHQDMKHQHGKTVRNEAAEAFAEVIELEKIIANLNEQFLIRTDYESDAYSNLLNILSDSTERLSILGAHSMQESIERVLMGLGFERIDLDRQTSEFSGGWRMRIELAKLLLQKPNLLLLDEPTNHLDIESIQWFEEFLQDYPGAIVLVSHDRAFLDAITKRTLEISGGKIFDFKANYTKYCIMREERNVQQLNELKNQDKYIEQTQQLIDKYRAKASKATFAQQLIKRLDKLERVDVDEADTSAMSIKFPEPARAGRVVVRSQQVAKSFGEKVVLKGVDFALERGERVAFVGKNGEGKTTFSKIIIKSESYKGDLEIGHNVLIGYYAQNQAEELDGEKTVFETIDDEAVGDIRKKVRQLLGSFLFGGDSVDKKVKVLSGGEKGRLALCKLLLQPYNLLVLDEPTNHLDMRSKEVLKQALISYAGALIVVSHDRDFLKDLTHKVIEFKGGITREYIGDVYEFLAQKKISTLGELNKKATPFVASSQPIEKKEDYKERKEIEKEFRKIEAVAKKREVEIARLEKLIQEMDEKLLDPEQFKIVNADAAYFKNYDHHKKQLELEFEAWALAQEEVEKFKRQQAV